MILAGLLTFVLVANVLRTRDATVSVAVASQDVAPGTRVTADMVRYEPLPAGSRLRGGMIDRPTFDSKQWVATRTITKDEPVLRSALGTGAARSGLRAMSIPVSPEHAAGGELGVGDRVDVVSADGADSTYVVQNAEVLGIAPRKGSGGLGMSSSGQFYVTVAVDSDSALRLASALRGGKVEVVRSTGATR